MCVCVCVYVCVYIHLDITLKHFTVTRIGLPRFAADLN